MRSDCIWVLHIVKQNLRMEEHKRGTKISLNNSSRNFAEVIMIAKKLTPENLVVLCDSFEKFVPIKLPSSSARLLDDRGEFRKV